MAEEPEASVSALIERLMTVPLFASFTTTRPESYPNHDSEDPDHESTNRQSPDRIIIINPLTQGMVVIGGNAAATGFDSLFNDLRKDGQPPASQASIDDLPSMEIKSEQEVENLGGECVICLEEWSVGDVVNELPCKHNFHGDCLKKWLKIHGSCPVCRHKMPVDDSGIKAGDESGERRRAIWLTFAFGNRRSSSDSESSSEESSIDESHDS